MTGQVYFIQGVGRIKIGWSANPTTRLKELSTSSQTALQMIGTINGSVRLERALHRHLKHHRVHREWFADCPEVRALLDLVMRSGPKAINFVDRDPKPLIPLNLKKVRPEPAPPPLLEWWEVAVKGYGAIFNRYEYTILNHPSAPVRRVAFMALKSAQDEVEKMLDRSAEREPTNDAHDKIQRWLAALERQMSEIISVKAA